jgi:hypothetical protein
MPEPLGRVHSDRNSETNKERKPESENEKIKTVKETNYEMYAGTVLVGGGECLTNI